MTNAGYMFLFLFLTVLFFAIGDFLGVFTKAKLSSVFVAMFLFLVGFMTKMIPADMIQKAGLSQSAAWSAPLLIFHMGTMINIKELIDEWRTVVMAIISMIVGIIAVFAVIPLVGKEAAVVSIPIINGGIIATQIMTGAAMEKGFQTVAALGTLVYAIQKFVGTPPASYFGMREGRKVLEQFRAGKIQASTDEKKAAVKETKVTFAKKNEKYFTSFICMAIAAAAAFISRLIQEKTGLNASITALLLGTILSYSGAVPNAILDKAKVSGFLSFAVFASLIPSLAKISFGDLTTLGFQLLLIFAAFVVGTYILIYLLPTWKIVGSRDLAMGIAMAQLLGFPATYLIANEIATALTDDEEEKNAILKRIIPAYVVAGLASVTTISIIIAGIFVEFL
ncbi:MAG: hypothetical protein ACLTXO_10785 [Fusobacterium varium]|jgi:hypothetical protein|uniref:Permease n=1 Tax=Fusobacterium varium ATCC 27725 TaxID=469618 RepID=A0ABM6U184_FUSVA|nr:MULTISPECIES: hypothetical protein [Fusobacterium]AVQ30048.1 hypothetical protein C4N18_01940 [Fusobacterium varium ATCC 27725]EES64931.1 hypothetical protein FVAG_01614 [Fusobacterium varium ATCC 27725]MCI6031786.1 hypothetical protein [Fusobacterium varium]UYI78448.1 MAG: hypothetical protein OGM09_15000 [Fusobacterium varium]HBJ79043.1 hypothetical protein [Fusobacterium sp.]